MIKQTRKLSNRKVLFTAIVLSLLALPLSAMANVSSVSFSAPQITGGTDARGVVTLATNAPIGGLKVTLTSNNPAATFPAAGLEPAGATTTITVPGGKNSAPFIVKTTALAQDAPVTITAGAKDASQSGTFTILAPVLKGLRLAEKVIGGERASGTVSLTGPAPSGGIAISLSSSSSKASVPTRFAVPAGQSSASFDIRTIKLTGSDEQATIEASSASGAKVSAQLTVTLPLVPEITSLTAESSVNELDSIELRFAFDRTLTTDHTLRITSNNQAVVLDTLASRISPSISRLLIPTQQVAADTNVTLTVTSGNSSKTVSVSVRAIKLSVTLSSNTITGGSNLSGNVALNFRRLSNIVDSSTSQNSGDSRITLTATDSSISIPSSITIPHREQSTSFEILTAPLTSQRNVNITLKMPIELGGEQQTISLLITPVTLASVSLEKLRCNIPSCGSYPNERSVNGIITLNGPAPTNGISLSLNSSNPGSATVPNTLLVPQGQTSIPFSVTLPSTATDGAVNIRVTTGSGFSKSAVLELEKSFLKIDSVTLSQTQVQGGTPVTGTVAVKQINKMGTELNEVTPSSMSGTVRVSTASIGGGTFQPVSFNVSPNQNGTFTYTPPSVTATTTIRITAIGDQQTASFMGGGTNTANLTVTPATMESFTLSESEVQSGGQFTGRVGFNGSIPFDNSVVFTSSDPNLIAFSGFRLASGTTKEYSFQTSSGVTSPTPVTITATFGDQTKIAELTVVKKISLSNVSFSLPKVFVGVPTKLKMEIDGPAYSEGATLDIRLQNPTDVQKWGRFEPRVVIPAGQTITTVDITPERASGTIPAILNIFYGTQQSIVSAIIENLALGICKSAPTTVVGGNTITCSLTIKNTGFVAPEGGLQIFTSNSNPSVLTVPPIITIPAGANSITFEITTNSVSQTTPVSIGYNWKPNASDAGADSFTLTPQ